MCVSEYYTSRFAGSKIAARFHRDVCRNMYIFLLCLYSLLLLPCALWQQYKLLHLKHRAAGYHFCSLHEQNNTFNLIAISSVTNFTAELCHFAAPLLFDPRTLNATETAE
jgi:hypothetical protein